jgi:hypothetical protein
MKHLRMLLRRWFSLDFETKVLAELQQLKAELEKLKRL